MSASLETQGNNLLFYHTKILEKAHCRIVNNNNNSMLEVHCELIFGPECIKKQQQQHIVLKSMVH